MKTCLQCKSQFSPVKSYFYLCPKCFDEGIVHGVRCSAVTLGGRQCCAGAVRGEVFCSSHLRSGYGLFTAAVLKAQNS